MLRVLLRQRGWRSPAAPAAPRPARSPSLASRPLQRGRCPRFLKARRTAPTYRGAPRGSGAPLSTPTLQPLLRLRCTSAPLATPAPRESPAGGKLHRARCPPLPARAAPGSAARTPCSPAALGGTLRPDATTPRPGPPNPRRPGQQRRSPRSEARSRAASSREGHTSEFPPSPLLRGAGPGLLRRVAGAW